MTTLHPTYCNNIYNVDGEPKKNSAMQVMLYFPITPDLSVCLQIKSLQKYPMPQRRSK